MYFWSWFNCFREMWTSFSTLSALKTTSRSRVDWIHNKHGRCHISSIHEVNFDMLKNGFSRKNCSAKTTSVSTRLSRNANSWSLRKWEALRNYLCFPMNALSSNLSLEIYVSHHLPHLHRAVYTSNKHRWISLIAFTC